MKERVGWKHLTLILAIIILASFAITGCTGGLDPDSDSGTPSGNVEEPVDAVDLADMHLFAMYYEKEYDGSEKKPAIEVRDNSNRTITTVWWHQEHEDLTVSFSNNINAGTATATVTAKAGAKAFFGSASVDFVIEQILGRVYSLSDFEEMVNDRNYHTVFLDTNLTIEEGDTVTIPDFANVDLRSRDVIINGTLVNNGTIKTSRKQGGYGEIFNNGTLTNNGTIDILKGDFVYNAGEFTNNGDINFEEGSGQCIFTNSSIDGNAIIGAEDYIVARQNIANSQALLEYANVAYDGTEKTPDLASMTLLGDAVDTTELKLEYLDNINAGEATVAITVDEKSQKYYGSTTKTFTIDKAKTTISMIGTTFIDLLNNPNYYEIEISNDSSFVDLDEDFTIREDLTLVINARLLKLLSTVTVDGKLVIKDMLPNLYARSTTYADTSYSYDPLKLVVNGVVDILAADEEISIAQLSGSGVVNNHLTVVLDGYQDLTPAYSGVTINNYGKLFEGHITSISDLQIVNKSGAELYLNEDTAVSVTANNIVEETGSIYTVRPAITTDSIRLKYSDNTLIPFENIEEDYNHGTAVYPAIGVLSLDCDTELLISDAYHRYTYAHETDGEEPVNIGKVDVVVEFDILSKHYYGSASTSYDIVPVVLDIESGAYTYGVFDNENYCGYNIKANIDWYYDIRDNTTVTVFENCSISGAEIRGNGVLINNGTIYSKKGLQNLVQGVDTDPLFDMFTGHFVNNGTVYVNGEVLGTPIVGGTIKSKKHIDNITGLETVADQEFPIEYLDTDYDIPTVCPQMSLKLDDTVLSLGADYQVEYTNNSRPDNRARASVSISSKDTSTVIYGVHNLIYFTITRGSAEVKTVSQLRKALEATTNNDSTQGAFITVTLTDTIINTISGKSTLTILKDTILDLNGYELAINFGSTTSGYKLVNYGKIIVRDDWKDSTPHGINGSRAYWSRQPEAYVAYGSSEIVGMVTTADGVFELSKWCDRLILQNDISESAYLQSGQYQAVELDLNGHCMGELTVKLTADTTIYSSVRRTDAPDGENDRAVIQDLRYGGRNEGCAIAVEELLINDYDKQHGEFDYDDNLAVIPGFDFDNNYQLGDTQTNCIIHRIVEY